MDKWYDIGLTLQVDRSILDDLTHSQDDDDLSKVMKILNCWKDTQPSPVTWETVITAMESPILNKKAKADMIRQHLRLSKLLFNYEIVFNFVN